MIRHFFVKGFLLIYLLLTACSYSDLQTEINAENSYLIKLAGEIEQITKARVNDGGFCHLDKIGVYIVDYNGDSPGILCNEGNRADNASYVFDEYNLLWDSNTDFYFKDNSTPVDIYGYYPYATTVDVNNYAFQVSANQNNPGNEGQMGDYEASDFLWCKASGIQPTTSTIILGFQHRMANVRVTLLEGEGFAKDEWALLDKCVLITNTRRNANINLSTGVVTAIGETDVNAITTVRSGQDFRAIVVPQTIAQGTPLLAITVGGVNYSFKVNHAVEYVSGKMFTYTLTVNKKTATGEYEFKLEDESVTAWEDELISHDVNSREYVVVESKAGELEQCILKQGKDYTKLQNLKIKGSLNASDFFFMRDRMSKLEALNIKDVSIEGYVRPNYVTKYYKNEIPAEAFSGKTSLKYLILPDKLVSIRYNAFNNSGLSGSLIIPDGVKIIERNAFNGCSYLTGRLVLPSQLESIEDNVFTNCNFNSEIYLPNSLKKIGKSAFMNCKGLRGNLFLPEALTELGSYAFSGCVMLSGSLIIPHGVKEIGSSTFSNCGFNGTLTLHDGITLIGDAAFLNTQFKGELNLPEQLVKLGWRVFANTTFSGRLKLPASLAVMGYGVFEGCIYLSDTLEIPKNIGVLDNTMFKNCKSLEVLVLPSTLQTVFSSAFENCFGLRSIVCLGDYPPQLQASVFNGVPKDNFMVEVPENAVSTYKNTSGWRDFKRITAHHELVCRPSVACALNKEHSEEIIVDAEGEWTVKSKPEWCTLSQSSGNGKTLVTLTIHSLAKGGADRIGEIVFELKDKNYTASCSVSQYDYEYEEDEFITLNHHTKGKGVNIVFLGDGYDAKSISDGTYLKDMKQQMEYFFGLPPYSTYRDYFRVYTGIALSQESGVGTLNTICYNKFGSTYQEDNGVKLKGDDYLIFAYSLEAPTVDSKNLNQTLIVMTPYSGRYGGTAWMYSDGCAVAYCPMSSEPYPYDARGLVQHEAGGHGFGKLKDEYIYWNEFYPEEEKKNLLEWQSKYGFFKNVSITGKYNEVYWKHMIFHEKYRSAVDVFEGADRYTRGIFRSEHNSCMNNNVPYYNAYSRELIVRRIMEYAGEPFNFNEFVEKDVMEPGESTSVTRGFEAPSWYRPLYHTSPVIYEGSPSILKSNK